MTNTLADYCIAIVDCEHKTAPDGDGFALLVGTRAMKSGRLVMDACKPVSEATYEAWTRRMRPEPGDLILAREAPVGQVVVVPESPPVCLGQRTVLIRPDAAAVDPRFLHYWLLGPVAQSLMSGQAAGATVPHLNVEDIRKLDVSGVPSDRQLQSYAAGTLGSVDHLVENNRRRIELLEQMAQAFYREWFVHFRYPGHDGDGLVDSDLGPFPEGWEVLRVAELASEQRNAVTGGPFGSKLGRKDYTDFGVPVIRGANLRVGGGFVEDDMVYVSDAKADELQSSTARRGDVVITQRGTIGQVGLIPSRSRFERYILSQSQMKITVDPTKSAPEFVYGQFRTPETTSRFITQAMTSGVPHVNLQLLREFQLVVPPATLQHEYAGLVESMADEQWLLAEQNRRLTAARDLLLPKLVTGEIDVSELDLDALVEAAGA